MYRIEYIWLIVVLVLSDVHGQVESPGVCPNLRTQRNFNALRYSGDWFEQERFFVFYQIGVDCSRATYTPNRDGSINVLNRGFNKREGRLTMIRGVARAPDPRIPSRLVVRFPMSVGNYWVLSTNYRTYSIVYSCRNSRSQSGPTKQEIVYILSRRRGYMDPRLREEIYRFLSTRGIDVSRLTPTDQTMCPV